MPVSTHRHATTAPPCRATTAARRSRWPLRMRSRSCSGRPLPPSRERSSACGTAGRRAPPAAAAPRRSSPQAPFLSHLVPCSCAPSLCALGPLLLYFVWYCPSCTAQVRPSAANPFTASPRLPGRGRPSPLFPLALCSERSSALCCKSWDCGSPAHTRACWSVGWALCNSKHAFQDLWDWAGQEEGERVRLRIGNGASAARGECGAMVAGAGCLVPVHAHTDLSRLQCSLWGRGRSSKGSALPTEHLGAAANQRTKPCARRPSPSWPARPRAGLAQALPLGHQPEHCGWRVGGRAGG